MQRNKIVVPGHLVSRVITRLRSTEGSVLPIVAVMLVTLIAFVGLGLDLGQMYEGRRQLQNSVDAAALAGARYLPADPDRAKATALYYLGLDGVTGAPDPQIETTFGTNDTISVSAGRNLSNFAMGIVGIPTTAVGAQARGIAGSVVASDCLLPLAALAGAPGYPGNPWFPFNTTVTLKEAPGGSWQGNFQGMDFDFKNTKEFFEALAGKCAGVTVGESYDTQTGSWGNTFLTSLEERVSSDPLGTPWEPLSAYVEKDPPDYGIYSITTNSTRFVYVPVVRYSDFIDANGKKPLEIIGVAKFFITFLGCDTKKNGPVPFWEPDGQNCNPGEGMLAGEFIQAYSTGTFGPADEYGTVVQRLWQ